MDSVPRGATLQCIISKVSQRRGEKTEVESDPEPNCARDDGGPVKGVSVKKDEREGSVKKGLLSRPS